SVIAVPEAPASADDRLVWIDLEMTGLDVDRHRIVELAVIVTDAQLEVLADGLDLVVHQPSEALAEMDDFVRKMHTKSGLLGEIERSQLSLDGADVRQLHRRRSSVPRPVPSRARPVPALPQHRRVVDQGALPALVPGRVQ